MGIKDFEEEEEKKKHVKFMYQAYNILIFHFKDTFIFNLLFDHARVGKKSLRN